MGQSAGDNHCEPVTRTKLKMNKSIIALLLIAQVFSSPLPQDPNDDAEVFGGPVRTNTDYDSDSFPSSFGDLFPRVRVFVVPVGTSDYEDLEPAFPSRRPSFGNVFNILRSVLGRGSPVLSSTDEETDTSAEERPCFLCSFFKDSFDDVQDHIDTVRDRQNEIDFDPEEDGLDINNSTHTTQVLEDGSVVHINKTVIADTDENGNSFFFHKAVFHNIGGSDDKTEEESDATEEEETFEETFDLRNEDED